MHKVAAKLHDPEARCKSAHVLAQKHKAPGRFQAALLNRALQAQRVVLLLDQKPMPRAVNLVFLATAGNHLVVVPAEEEQGWIVRRDVMVG